MNFEDYDYIIVAFSGGKDSTACYLHLLDNGVPPEKIELWHHCIDGKEPAKGVYHKNFMDWPITEDYCRKFAKHFGSPLYFSWRKGGFQSEMLREDDYTEDVYFETPEGLMLKKSNKTNEKFKNTRRKFPQVSADLSVRWCSSYLKIDVGKIAINNQDRFINAKTLFITGERSEESSSRSNYAEFEKHSCHKDKRVKRHIYHWRPIHKWSEQEVWNIIQKFSVRVHPAYYAGWGRVSCQFCIFGNANQWASAWAVNPSRGQYISGYEDVFGVTIKRDKSIIDLVNEGKHYPELEEKRFREPLRMTKYKLSIVEEGIWQLPSGAYGDTCGPT